MKKKLIIIPSIIIIAVIMLYLTLGLVGCHTILTCPVCTKTVDSKYYDFLLTFELINPDATEVVTAFCHSNQLVETYTELKESLSHIKGMMLPRIPDSVLNNCEKIAFYALLNKDGEICGYEIYCKLEAESIKSGDITYVSFYGGPKRMSNENLYDGYPLIGASPTVAWDDVFHGIDTFVEYGTKAHFFSNPYYGSEVGNVINLGFYNDYDVFHTIRLSVEP